MAARLKDILDALSKGGELRYTWSPGKPESGAWLVLADGERVPVDGRSYHAFVMEGYTDWVAKVETGVKEGADGERDLTDLVIRWRSMAAQEALELGKLP